MANWRAIMLPNRVMAAGMAGLAAALATAPIAAAPEGATQVTCTNPVSGASWQIVIDYSQGTVDSHPARITPGTISWFDPKDGGNYTLDRTSGALVASVASSTGGYFRRGRCDLATSR